MKGMWVFGTDGGLVVGKTLLVLPYSGALFREAKPHLFRNRLSRPTPPAAEHVCQHSNNHTIPSPHHNGNRALQLSPNTNCVRHRCPSDKKPKSPISAIAVSMDEATMAVGCEDGSLHGMKLSLGGMGVQHVWSKPPPGEAASVLAMDISADGKVRIGGG